MQSITSMGFDDKFNNVKFSKCFNSTQIPDIKLSANDKDCKFGVESVVINLNRTYSKVSLRSFYSEKCFNWIYLSNYFSFPCAIYYLKKIFIPHSHSVELFPIL